MSTPAPAPDRIPPAWGGPLTENDYATLAASWITSELADQAMLRRVGEQQGREVVVHKGKRDCSGVLFSYYEPGNPYPFNYRVRRDNPDYTVGKDGKPKAERKYLGAPKSGNRIYFPPSVTSEQLHDVTIPILVVEGEKKTLAGWRLAIHGRDNPRFIPIGIAGVWNWRGIVGKANGARGERVDVKGPIPDLGRIEWKGRKVYIVFDANVNSNDSVKWARKGIARELATRGAEADFVNLPEDCDVNGIDDLLALWGPDRVLALFEKAVPSARLNVLLPPQFQKKPQGMFRVVEKGGQLEETQLTNYLASITTNITMDDGLETKRDFEIQTELMGRTFQFTIPAVQFTPMDWPIEQMGAGAITYPNKKEYARTAIQSFSLTADERRIYTHTGWRQVDGGWIYLDAAGAVGEAGRVPGVDVRLTGTLGRYELRLPATHDALVSAVRASLRLAELGPEEISFPLRAATYRSVFGDSDFSVHLAGQSGAFKSELAALEQQHFGAAMTRLNLPAAWSSTGNALELLAFYAKDALLVVDDFAPQGSAADVARYHAAADRVFRAAGNRAGRSRLDSTARLREAKPPRALILSTGEDVPRGYSVRARLLILELSKGTIDVAKLTACQEEAAAGLYADAMGGYIRWIAESYDERRAAFFRRVAELRMTVQNTGHARTPEIIASLHAGFEFYLEFAADCGAITLEEQDVLTQRCWEALLDAAKAQAKHQAGTEPATRFIILVRACLVSGRAHLAGCAGGQPTRSPESCGWRNGNHGWQPQGDCIGWIDGEEIYLQPDAAYLSVQNAGRDGGEALGITEQTLRKRLREKGLLVSTDEKRETLTIRKTLAGSQKSVLHISRDSLLPEEPE